MDVSSPHTPMYMRLIWNQAAWVSGSEPEMFMSTDSHGTGKCQGHPEGALQGLCLLWGGNRPSTWSGLPMSKSGIMQVGCRQKQGTQKQVQKEVKVREWKKTRDRMETDIETRGREKKRREWKTGKGTETEMGTRVEMGTEWVGKHYGSRIGSSAVVSGNGKVHRKYSIKFLMMFSEFSFLNGKGKRKWNCK